MQRYVTPDDDFDPVATIRSADRALWPIALLDIVCNNADRKAGHVLREQGTMNLFGIDHGLTFHPQEKLRTVLWFFAGQALPPEAAAGLDALATELEGELGRDLENILGPAERSALTERVGALLDEPVHPHPPLDRPPVPWPPI